MAKQLLSPSLLLFLFHLCTETSGQSSLSGPAEVTAALGKAGKFTTQVDTQINDELKKKSTPGITVFAPTDGAFSELKPGTDAKLIQQSAEGRTDEVPCGTYLPHCLPVPDCEQPTAYGGRRNTAEFPLNVIGNGPHVNKLTGVVKTTVDSTVYTDGQPALYEIPQVLLSQGILGPQAPAPAPLPSIPKKAAPLNSAAPTQSTALSVDSSGAEGLPLYAPAMVSVGVAFVAALCPFHVNGVQFENCGALRFLLDNL